ncbi:proto-oncogene Mas-like [Candoia aspera]|uniref:proto-oncogene Mas-like n=1 Tax=Candoia aspera TaxID=51853 RepID=UPI002FD80424
MTTNMPITFSGIMDTKMGNWTFSYIEHNDSHAIHSEGSVYQPRYPGELIIHSLIILICILGVIGNGTVIRLLGFQIKRSCFTIFILNLAVADSGTLISLFLCGILYIKTGDILIEIVECLVCNYCAGQLLLTIISIDRCLAIFFPIWYRCHQPPYLSTMLCAITWIVSFFPCAIHYTLISVTGIRNFRLFYYVFIYTTICFPLMVVSSLALFIKGYLTSQMQKRGKLLTAILLALFFFLLFSFPPIIVYLIDLISNGKYVNLFAYGYLSASLNSSVNPLIYFLLGRKKEHNSMCNLKIILQRVFKEEEENEEQPEFQAGIQL